MTTFLNLVSWAAIVGATLGTLAAAFNRIGLAAVLVTASTGMAAAVCVVEERLVWALLPGAVALAVPVVYWRHVRLVRRRAAQERGAR